MNLYLSPNGRIDQSTYWRGVIILFVVATVVSVISAYTPPIVGIALVIPYLFVAWCWIALHVKRFHDADMTGWITIGMVVLAIVLSMVLNFILPGLFGVDMAAMQNAMTEDIQDVTSSNDPAAIVGVAMEHSKKIAQAQLLPSIVSSAIVTGVVGFVMSLFKSTPGTNKFGPPPGGPSEETFA